MSGFTVGVVFLIFSTISLIISILSLSESILEILSLRVLGRVKVSLVRVLGRVSGLALGTWHTSGSPLIFGTLRTRGTVG